MACGWDGSKIPAWNFYKLILTPMPGKKQADNYFAAIKHFLMYCIYVHKELIKISGKINSCFYNFISSIFPSGLCLTIFGSWSLEMAFWNYLYFQSCAYVSICVWVYAHE